MGKAAVPHTAMGTGGALRHRHQNSLLPHRAPHVRPTAAPHVHPTAAPHVRPIAALQPFTTRPLCAPSPWRCSVGETWGDVSGPGGPPNLWGSAPTYGAAPQSAPYLHGVATRRSSAPPAACTARWGWGILQPHRSPSPTESPNQHQNVPKWHQKAPTQHQSVQMPTESTKPAPKSAQMPPESTKKCPNASQNPQTSTKNGHRAAGCSISALFWGEITAFWDLWQCSDSGASSAPGASLTAPSN